MPTAAAQQHPPKTAWRLACGGGYHSLAQQRLPSIHHHAARQSLHVCGKGGSGAWGCFQSFLLGVQGPWAVARCATIPGG